MGEEEQKEDGYTETGEIKEKDISDEWLDSYKLNVNNTLIDVNIFFRAVDPVPIYEVNITNMTKTTKIILEKIREEFPEGSFPYQVLNELIGEDKTLEIAYELIQEVKE